MHIDRMQFRFCIFIFGLQSRIICRKYKSKQHICEVHLLQTLKVQMYVAQFKKAAWLTAGQTPDISPSSWAYLKLTEQRVNAKKKKKNAIRWCFIDPGLSCKITVQFCCFRIYCTCLLKQSWTAAKVVAGSPFQSGEEREESRVINNTSSVLLLQWSVAFHTWSSQWLSLQVFRSLLMWGNGFF